MNEEPRLLAGRYEVGDLIGRGGMAEVHIGYDTRLGRNVAIKILRADLARDPSFQTRFRREAQAAAGLNHPAIVAVYDTGEDQVRSESGALQAVPFIVMEYVEGHTVRDILKGDVAAPIDEAVEITVGVLSALEYAHHAGLVHRDIKPANVMLTPTGAVKVMDFGIARALADVGQTMTQTQAVVGTAQYLSPEQARGENVDARSDLYSTGCLLFELLTGRPPFMGDSPVSVAYQHVREAAPKPSQFASDVPAALDAVVERALQKDRNLRYSSAQEFMVDLQRAIGAAAAVPAVGLPGVGAPGVGAPGVGAATAVWPQGVGAGAAAGVASGVGAAGVGAAAAANPYAPGGAGAFGGAPVTGPTAVMPVTPAAPGWGAVVGGPASVPPAGHGPQTATIVRDEDYVVDNSRRRLMIQLGIAAAAVVGLSLLVFGLFSLTKPGNAEPSPSVEMVTIPILENVQQTAAEKRLTDIGLVPEIQEEVSADVEVGRVIRTDPEFNTEVAVGSTVILVISTGPDEAKVPDVRGMLEADAKLKLEDAGLTVVQVIAEHSPDIQTGRAIRTDPESGTTVDGGSNVILYVSDGQVEVPDLRTKSSTEAQQALVALGLVASIQEVETTSYDQGVVFEQSPLPGLAPQGSTVTIKVAKAPTTATVPDVVGKTQADATAAITGVGLKVTVETAYSDTVDSGKVIAQSIPGGTTVGLNTSIRITVSNGPDPTP